jgi:hypothetical protein
VASWGEIEHVAPELARQARTLLDAHVHKTMATLRADGSPRISGIEAKFISGAGIEDELWFGSMPGSRKSADLVRDPRFSLRSGSDDPPDRAGDVRELAVTRLPEAKDELAIDWWSEADGLRSLTRK